METSTAHIIDLEVVFYFGQSPLKWAKLGNWANAYVTRPKQTHTDPEPVTQYYHVKEPTHPGWTIVRRKQHMVVYTDGSYRKERAAGTYAWVAGWHDETGTINKSTI